MCSKGDSMKKAVIICVSVAYAGMSTALVMSHERPIGCLNTGEGSDYTIINLSNMTTQQLEGFFKGETVQLVLECPEGASLPLHLSIAGEFLALESLNEAPYLLKIVKTCFIKNEKQTFYFSDDCVHWKEYQDFFSGNLGLSFDGSEVELKLDLNKKPTPN